jgi:RNA polymerase sigma-70 factor (ECF subfamily)
MSGIDDEDKDLIKQCKAGNKKAFEVLLVKYQQKIFNQCYFLLNQNKEEAEDAAQAVFINVYNNISSFKGDSKFSTWLYKITKNHCLNLIKRRNNSPVSNAGDDSTINRYSTTPAEKANDEKECVKQKVKSLEDMHREIITLIHFDELTYEEAAENLDCPVGTIRSRVNRAMKKLGPMLRECL